MAKRVIYSRRDEMVVNLLKNHPEGMTTKEIMKELNIELLPGHMTGMVKKGLIAPIGDKENTRIDTRSNKVYHLVTTEELTNAEGKPFHYTDNEKALLAAAATLAKDFTLADLAAAMGKDKLSSGSINALVRIKGNIVKTDATRDVEVVVKTPNVNVYGFAADIPADAEIKD